MSSISHFESRSGSPECTPEQIYYFVTDIRNFERFVPEGTVKNWRADSNSCSFSVPRVGEVELSIAQKDQNKLVVYKGNALKDNDFEVFLHIDRQPDDHALVKVTLNAGLNPVMKLVASRPINQFLEVLIDRIESFNCWDEISE